MKTKLRSLVEKRIKSYIYSYLSQSDKNERQRIANYKDHLNWTEMASEEDELLYAVLNDISDQIGPYWKWAEKVASEMAASYPKK